MGQLGICWSTHSVPSKLVPCGHWGGGLNISGKAFLAVKCRAAGTGRGIAVHAALSIEVHPRRAFRSRRGCTRGPVKGRVRRTVGGLSVQAGMPVKECSSGAVGMVGGDAVLAIESVARRSTSSQKGRQEGYYSDRHCPPV